MKRFWDKVDKTGDCWEWTAYKDRDGYGTFRMDGVSTGAHRVSVVLDGRDIGDGMCVCHTCDNRSCVNPDHLYVGTNLDNMRDKVVRGRSARGEKNGNSKFGEDLILKVRSASGSHANISERYGVSTGQVHNIRSGKCWAHV